MDERTNVRAQEIDGGESDILDPFAFIVPRLEGLLDILGELGMRASLYLDEDIVPYVTGKDENDITTFFTYLSVDVMAEGKFVLEMTRTIQTGEEDSETTVVDIASFNMDSEFGFAAQDPQTGDVILRAQVPEAGGVSREWYEFVLELFEDGAKELSELLSAEE